MEEERSAGGIVFYGELVLVLRNHRGEYIFPKGHLEPGETQMQAAQREVFEEAGIMPQVVCFAKDTSYSYRAPGGIWRQKRVSWYLMEANSPELVVDDYEIKWGRFLTVEEAKRVLTHDLDRGLLADALILRAERQRLP